MLGIKPQPGPQTKFLRSKADIAVYGGAAGGGKSFALLLEPLYHYENPKFGGVIFRRSTVQIRNEGGLWDESMGLYTALNAHPREATLEWEFPPGSRMKFAHLEHEKTVYDWQGAQIPYIGFDELTHFTEKQFFYMLSRNRSMSGVPGYVRATCNPDVDSWVRKLIDWYIDDKGYPIKERSGVIRWFIRIDDNLVWGNTRRELVEKYGGDQQPKSFTFIAANIRDNKILMEKDPAYLSNLMALSRVERERLLGGNWNIRPSAGNIFRREWFEVIDEVSASVTIVGQVRGWDRAATRPSFENPDPDWSRGLKLLRLHTGAFVIAHIASTQDTPLKVEEMVQNTASQDGTDTRIVIEQEPGASGVADADNYVRLLAGYDVRVVKSSKDKVTRALPVSAQAERGNIKILRGPWNEAFFKEAENFPPEEGKGHDDQVDALSVGFNELCGDASILDVL